MGEMKPCPFWCSPSVITVRQIESRFGTRYAVTCHGCDCGGPVAPTPEAAIVAWNIRAPVPPWTVTRERAGLVANRLHHGQWADPAYPNRAEDMVAALGGKIVEG